MTPTAHLDKLVSKYPVLGEIQDKIQAAYEMINLSLLNGGTLLICGNGGSASDSEHIAGELLKGFLLKRPLSDERQQSLRSIQSGEESEYLATHLQAGLRAIALTSHPALSTAVANDLGADLAFAQQVNALGSSGDILLGISTSGNARNIRLAAITAKAYGLNVIGLTGRTGGQLLAYTDICLCVPADQTYIIQELHLPVYHTLCAMLEAAFFK